MNLVHTAKKFFQLADSYVIARLQNRPSTAQFWYLPEPVRQQALTAPQTGRVSPLYFIDYSQKLTYTLENADGIIILPYPQPIGHQINPEAAFQYALGLHDSFVQTGLATFREKFFHYARYFLEKQTAEGNWRYHFDWFESRAPWYSALAQARGASVMLRAFLLDQNPLYATAARKAFSRFSVPVANDGFLHIFAPAGCPYFEEYPCHPTGVLNGFMASLISLHEVAYWLKEDSLKQLWHRGIKSLEKMLPWYSAGWWSLYDHDPRTPLPNVNSPRYHLLEIHYLTVLGTLSGSCVLAAEQSRREHQLRNPFLRLRALGQKLLRKLLYR